MNLLVTHDDTLFSALIVEFLRFQRYAVSETKTIETTLTALEQRKVDLAICVLPDDPAERLSILAELRHRHPSLPLIALAANSMSDQMQAQIQEYTPHYLTRPFAVVSLLGAIADATGIRKTRMSFSATGG